MTTKNAGVAIAVLLSLTQVAPVRAEFGSFNGQTMDPNANVKVIQPANLEQLQAAILSASKAGKKVRMSGQSHSTSSVILSDDSSYIKTTKLSRIGNIVRINGQPHIEVESGVELGQLADHLAKKGYSLGFAFPAFRGLTIAGLIATGSHGSSRRHMAVSAQTVGEVTLVKADGRLQTITPADGDVFKAATVNLGMLGAVYSLKIRVVPQFKLKMVTTVIDGSPENVTKLIRSRPSEDSLAISWYPNLGKAIVYTGTKTNELPMPGAENITLGPDRGVDATAIKNAQILAAGRASAEIDAKIEASRFDTTSKAPPFVYIQNGKDVNAHMVVGPSNMMTLARGRELRWAFTLTDNSFAFPADQALGVMGTIRDFAKRNNYSFPITGVYFRFAMADGGETSLLSHIESRNTGKRLFVLAEFLEYKPIGNGPAPRGPRDGQRDALLKLLASKHGVRFHHGKNSDWILQPNFVTAGNQDQVQRFLKIADQMDPAGTFRNRYVTDLLSPAAK